MKWKRYQTQEFSIMIPFPIEGLPNGYYMQLWQLETLITPNWTWE